MPTFFSLVKKADVCRKSVTQNVSQKMTILARERTGTCNMRYEGMTGRRTEEADAQKYFIFYRPTAESNWQKGQSEVHYKGKAAETHILLFMMIFPPISAAFISKGGKFKFLPNRPVNTIFYTPLFTKRQHILFSSKKKISHLQKRTLPSARMLSSITASLYFFPQGLITMVEIEFLGEPSISLSE